MGVTIKVSGVDKVFSPAGGHDIGVLDRLSVEFAAGSITGIIGPSGSGKSTLLHIIGTLETPTAGTVTYDGTPAPSTEKDLAAFRRDHIGFVFQQHHLIPHLTVLENVLVPELAGKGKRLSGDAVSRAKLLLGRVGLSERTEHKPGELSGGECQRVAVVRALLQNPDIVLADEPTGALDASTASNLLDLLLELQREDGFTLIVVTHTPEIAARLGRIVRLEAGKLIEVNG
jgi:ABC-type lipoprotein export system ATPase subunit